MNIVGAGAGSIDPLKIELRSIASLVPAKRNARKHSDKQIAQIAASIAQFGFLVPILVNSSSRIVAGLRRNVTLTVR